MKKILCLLLAAAAAVSIAGCSEGETQPTVSPAATASAPSTAATSEASAPAEAEAGNAPSSDSAASGSAGSDSSEDGPVAPSSNTEVVTSENAPAVFIILNSEDSTDNITYHLEGCEKLEGKDSQQVSWEMIQTIGYHQCPVCNPPRYEGYVE